MASKAGVVRKLFFLFQDPFVDEQTMIKIYPDNDCLATPQLFRGK